jgi:hypothetical protein
MPFLPNEDKEPAPGSQQKPKPRTLPPRSGDQHRLYHPPQGPEPGQGQGPLMAMIGGVGDLKPCEKIDSKSQIPDSRWMQVSAKQGLALIEYGILDIRSDSFTNSEAARTSASSWPQWTSGRRQPAVVRPHETH